jgi:hypothetical protein
MKTKEIKKWLIDADLTQAQIAREAKVVKAVVTMAIQGKWNSGPAVERVLAVLRKKGCPEEFLKVPEKPDKAA